MPLEVKEILFFSEPKDNVLYGPISINKKSYMFFKIEGWNTAVSVTDEQKKQSIIDAQKLYNELNSKDFRGARHIIWSRYTAVP